MNPEKHGLRDISIRSDRVSIATDIAEVLQLQKRRVAGIEIHCVGVASFANRVQSNPCITFSLR